MPTPRDSPEELPPQLEPHVHTSCPPDSIDRPAQWSQQVLGDIEHVIADVATSSGLAQQLEQSRDASVSTPDACADGSESQLVANRRSSRSTIEPTPPPTADSQETVDEESMQLDISRLAESFSPALDLSLSDRHGLMSSRLIQTHTSCKLRGGSKYRGTQTSDQRQYHVEVVVKAVDMSESFICGYLKIEGLTPEHATLTTYFEGEIIGPKYTFQTRHDSWGASEKDDMKHWGHFPAWKPLAKQAKKADFHYKHTENRENIFMRWKEKFLVPDHRVKDIPGASFEGFYYICFNQIAGVISGIYYHSKSDQHHNNKIQKLELTWVPDNGCFASTEFR